MATHVLKSWPQFFRAIVTGERRHELRRNDRGFAVGDEVTLREFQPRTETYTGATLEGRITSITSADVPCAVSDRGLSPDFCIFTLEVDSISLSESVLQPAQADTTSSK